MEENTNEILSALMTTYIAQMDSALKISEFSFLNCLRKKTLPENSSIFLESAIHPPETDFVDLISSFKNSSKRDFISGFIFFL